MTTIYVEMTEQLSNLEAKIRYIPVVVDGAQVYHNMTALRFVGATGVVTHAGGGVIDVNFSGLGGSTYKHTQASASDTWTVNHNLGYNPTVQVFNSGGQVVIADISHTSLNQTVISASLAFSGYALFT
ncbi:hypothetical protein [Candidatus Macondimonas diazotrophica]|jgi:hypothetical protein|uniref:Uncharacterized protein n=1 Tax=Candidatus Macondimonas diazotrophica TaxID=2305248 RepID=A0A4Z0F711_9GAMM|nr:hypothetical protein [Candidatus Macondimonas diazotrophica]TFZ81157.1 hypothetical protein E4680_13555 [Candidatus Macondimonas diazotrophica]